MNRVSTVMLSVAIACLIRNSKAALSHPHIVFVFVDDMGWNDLSYQGTDSATKTPHIDTLAAEGVKLNNYYVQPICSPSRVAFLTGRYPYKIGVLTTFGAQEKSCMPFVGLLPETLATFGYKNHLIGKWHLGYCKQECLPTSRGFDTFSGFYNGAEDYRTHIVADGYDWNVINSTGTYVMWEYDGVYGVDLMDKHVKETISSHDADTPMFLYYAMQSAHTPIDPRPDDVTEFSSVADEDRKNFLALIKGVDDSIDVLVTALKDAGMFDDTIIVLSADNGGQPGVGANNWPLSGSKSSYYEGGVKAGGFVTGKGITNTNVVSDGLMHAVDWFNTFMGAIGETEVSGLDSVNQWPMISTGAASARTELVHNVDTTKDDSVRPYGAIRKDEMKLISLSINTHERTAPPESSETSETGLNTDGVQLYNLTADPFERTNLANDSDYRSYRLELIGLLQTARDEDGVASSVHLDGDPNVVNMDANDAFITGWC